MTIGIDIGSTATKAIAVETSKLKKLDNLIFCRTKIRTDDPVSSASGVLGKLIAENDINISLIKNIKITGVGAASVPDSLFGIKVEKISEIDAIGSGAMFVSGKENIIVANIGTGTAIVEAGKNEINHLGGTGMGGGTIHGLGKQLLGLSEFGDLMALAEKGDLSRVDLLLEDVTETKMSLLNQKATASNFGKMLDTAKPEDIAMGIVSMVYQVVGTIAVFAAKSRNKDKVIVTGNGSNNSIGQSILGKLTEMYSVEFEYPEYAEYASALGAGLDKI